jgi:AcrR family transcriptional regulator
VATAAVRRGRPKIHEDEAILEAALREFAIKGYEGTSLRSLNSDLGLSHGTINMRFGSKDQLYLEAVDHSFTALLADTKAIVDSQPLPDDPLEELRIRFRAFLLASARRPFLNRLINNEGVHSSPLLDHIFDTFILPSTRPTRRLMKRLVAEGVLAPHSERSILFLLAHGAGAVFSLAALAAKYDDIDGPVDVDAHVDEMATILVNGLRRYD